MPVRFPADETGRNQKLSRPLHGPYQVVAVKDPDTTVAKIFSPCDKYADHSLPEQGEALSH